MHHYSKQIFEAVRISYLLNNRCFVVSETSVNYCYHKVNLTLMPYENLVETCREFLKHPAHIELFRQQNYEEFKHHYPMTQLIKKVL